MLIAWLEPPSGRVQGDQIYRTRQPCQDLAAIDGTYTVCGHWLDAAMRRLCVQADVLVAAQCVEADLLGVFAERRRRGLPTVVEINDNFLEPRAFGEVGAFYHAPERRALALQLVAAADALQVSTPYLAQCFGPRARATWVLPNAIDTLPPLAAMSPRGDALRIGWAGSAGHAEDLRTVMPALRALLQQLPDATLAIMAPQTLRPLFDWAPPARFDWQPDADLATYLRFLSTLDVGLAPLCDTPFNRGRSDVKFLEYAAAGACAVLQRAPAYADVLQQGIAAPFGNNEELIVRVRDLAGDGQRRAELRARAHAYVAASRTRPPMAARRHALLQALWRDAPGCASPPSGGRPGAKQRFANVVAATRGHAAASHPTRGLIVGFSPASAHLFNGLLAANAGKDPGPDFARATASAPHDYLPPLYAGHYACSGTTARKLLQRACTLAPYSVAAAHAEALRALHAGAPADAAAACAPHLQHPLPYPPLLATYVEAVRRAASDLADAARLAPMWAALAAQVDHPQLACALAREALHANDAISATLTPAALGALRRAARAPGGADADGERTLLEAQLLHRCGAHDACWRLLEGPCREGATAAHTWPAERRAALLALAAQAAARRGRPVAARQLVARARALVHIGAVTHGGARVHAKNDAARELRRDLPGKPANL